MSLSQIRNRIEALERKLALPLAIVRLRPLAEAICDDWAVALAAHKPVPEPHSIVRRGSQPWLPPPRFHGPSQVRSNAVATKIPSLIPMASFATCSPGLPPAASSMPHFAGTPPPGNERSRPAVASRRPRWQLTVRHSRQTGNPRVVDVNVGSASRPPDSERYRVLLPSCLAVPPR